MRSGKVFIVVGARNTGKTDLVKRMMKLSTRPKKLVVESHDSDKWHTLETHDDPNGSMTQIPEIQIEALSKWRLPGVARMCSSEPDKILTEVARSIEYAVVVMEDASIYFNARALSPAQKKIILETKQRRVDLIVVMHSMKRIPEDLVSYADFMVLLKTADNRLSNYHKDKFPDNVIDAWETHQKEGKDYEYLTINIGK